MVPPASPAAALTAEGSLVTSGCTSVVETPKVKAPLIDVSCSSMDGAALVASKSTGSSKKDAAS
eukprot:280533-Prymnesium_polylepis.1